MFTPIQSTVNYLEIVTPDVDAMCELYTMTLGYKFSEAVPELGNARVEYFADRLRLGIRAPMHGTEVPTVRTYFLVNDVDKSVQQASKLGANILLERMEIPGHGVIAIYEFGGVQHGLWQNE